MEWSISGQASQYPEIPDRDVIVVPDRDYTVAGELLNLPGDGFDCQTQIVCNDPAGHQQFKLQQCIIPSVPACTSVMLGNFEEK